MQNEIYLRRSCKIILSKKDSKNSKRILATFLKNISSIGFTFSKQIIDILKTYSIDEINHFYKNISKDLKTMLGNVEHKPMYPNFPEQVMEMSEFELYFNAIIHYVTLELPEIELKKRSELKELSKLRIIKLGTKVEFINIFKNILRSNVALSTQDKEDVKWFIKQYRQNIKEYLPEKIENKENMSFIISILKEEQLLSDEILSKYFKTATDVLRFITALSDGDVSLASNTKFINFKRSDRKVFLKILENAHSNIAEDMLRYKNKWLRIGEILHPSEYKIQFPKVYKAFDAIRNDKHINTFNNLFEEYIKEKDLNKLLKLLCERPGEFARRLDRVLRNFSVHTKILTKFKSIANKVSSQVLLQNISHFKHRNTDAYRVFFPKGNITKAQLIDNKLSKIKDTTCKKVIDICEKALIKQFSKKEKLGKVYIDEKLKDYTVPFALRSASKSLRTVTRGSKIKLDAGNTIRMFIHWKNIKPSENAWDYNRVDIDLSAEMFDKNFKYLEHVSYTNLRSANYKAAHSGDITSAPNGASEFIDIDIESALKYNAKYIVMNILSFTQQEFSEIPECFAGCMMRKECNSGEIYEPKTVKDRFDLASASKIAIPLIFDLENKQIIWCDMSLTTRARYNAIECNQTGIIATAKALTNLSKPNLYDLFMLHAKARGKLVKTEKSAKTMFSVDKGVTPFDIEKITSEYL